MTLPSLLPRAIATIALAFATTLAVLLAVQGSGRPAGPASAVDDAGPSRSVAAAIEGLEAATRARPDDPRQWSALGDAYLQRVRENGDTSLYRRADAAFHRALRLDPRDAAAVVGLGQLALARHHFDEGLRHGRKAQRLAPGSVAPYPVIVDGLVELGRYSAAERELQRMVDLKPSLAAYARVSYLRELHGDIPGAVRAMRLATSGGPRGENGAYVQSLLGGLELGRGRLIAAERAYRAALQRSPGYAPALSGLARIQAVQGDLDGAIRGLRDALGQMPSWDAALRLAEAELAAGERVAARSHLARTRRELAALTASGENADLERTLFEATYGDRRRAVELGRRQWRAAPSVRSADALGWALTRAGRPEAGLRFARRALRLGSRDPMFLVHAGIAARGAGRPAEARRHLRRALADNPRFAPMWAARARRALAEIAPEG
jgi:tetratricopeptide (TPR) repeat protein